MSTKRNTATRDRHRGYIARTKPACGICKEPIDYSLPHLDPRAYVVDHIIPLSKGGTDTLDNKQAAHRDCNSHKSDKTPDEWNAANAPRTFVTHRTW
ncbi:HNH endonuclease [Nocardia wallacei]|uniref:HNH endonuclease n=1 Tax=Nocardia wallacei TaxID=480035 RepID=UPI0024566FBE|nr:HNH endonuclease signature motif containing protein [Nocardia wallacei]